MLAHDVNTLIGFFNARVAVGLPVPGLFLVRGDKPIGAVIDSLVLIVAASEQAGWLGAIHFLPL